MSAFRWTFVLRVLLLGVALAASFGCADEPAAKTANKGAAKPPAKPVEPTTTAIAAPKPEDKEASELVKISKEFDVWIDLKRKLVVVDGEICLREGQLEMFACPKGTKEHESIVAVKSNSQTVHAALLAVGAKEGSPVKYDPKYEPATGTTVEIMVLWTDQDGKSQKVRAQQWIRNVKTEKEMEYSWVFAGSKFWTDEDTGQKYYQGDAGDLVCVSNFPTATLDLPVESSQTNDDLMFEAFQDRIPPRGTKVRLELIPKLAKPLEPAKTPVKKTE